MAKKTRSARGRAAGAGGGLSRLSVADLRREIGRRQKMVGGLMRKREKLVSQLNAIDAELAEYGNLPGGGAAGGRGRGPGRPAGRPAAAGRRGGGGGGGGGRRPRNDATLVESLKKVLTGKTMSVTEVAQAVQEAGYKTSSPSFRTIVNQTLINSGEFKRVGRGQYTAK